MKKGYNKFAVIASYLAMVYCTYYNGYNVHIIECHQISVAYSGLFFGGGGCGPKNTNFCIL